MHKGIPHLHSGTVETGGCREDDQVLSSESSFKSKVETASVTELILCAEGPKLLTVDLHQNNIQFCSENCDSTHQSSGRAMQNAYEQQRAQGAIVIESQA